MRDLRPPYDYIGEDLYATLKEAHSNHGKEFSVYPTQMAIEHILQKYELKLRTQPLDREDIREPELPCLVCGQELGSHIRESSVSVGKGKARMHPECVAERK